MDISHGDVHPSKEILDTNKYPYNTVISFSCDSGYNLNDTRSITCLASGKWDGSIPRCNQGNKHDICDLKKYATTVHNLILQFNSTELI